MMDGGISRRRNDRRWSEVFAVDDIGRIRSIWMTDVCMCTYSVDIMCRGGFVSYGVREDMS